MKRIAVTALIAALTACGSTRLANELRPYVGHDLHELTAHLGNPTGRRESADGNETTGDRWYVWSTDSDGVLPAAPTATSTGASNSGAVSYAGSSTPTGLMAVQFECTIEVAVDAHNIIQRYEFEGSNAGCRPFRQQLSH